jgi:hypothetical protein
MSSDSRTSGIRWIQEWKTSGDIDFRIGREDDALIAEWIGICSLRAARSGDLRAFVVHEGVASEVAAKVRNGMAAGLLRHLQGGVALHASGISWSGMGVAFVGESQSGKSTTAAELCRDASVEMLSDDTLILEESGAGFMALPTEATHWLRPDAAALFHQVGGPRQKLGVPGARPSLHPVELGLVLKLTFDEALTKPCIRTMGGAETFHALTQSHMRFAIDDPAVMIRDLELLSRLSSTIPIRELRRPRTHEVLAMTRDLVQSTVRGLVPGRRGGS